MTGTIKKALAGKEDLLLGAGTSPQIRNGEPVEITKINASVIPYSGDIVTENVITIKEKIDSVELTADAILPSESTGLVHGGELSYDAGSPAIATIAAGSGYIIDTTTNPVVPVRTLVVWDEILHTPTYAPASDIIALVVAINSAGEAINLGFVSPQDRRNYIILGLVIVDTDTGNLAGAYVVNSANNFSHNPASSMYDMMESWGAFSIEGNLIAAYNVIPPAPPEGDPWTQLSLSKTAGKYFRNGANVKNDLKNPHIINSPADFNVIGQFNIKLSDGTDITLTARSVDPNIWDDGSSTPAVVPVGKFTIQLISQFAEGVVEVSPGLGYFNFMSEAVAALPTTDPDTYKSADSKKSVSLSFLVIQQGTTILKDNPLAAQFYSLAKKNTLGGIGYQPLLSAGMVYDPGLIDHGDGSISINEGVVNAYSTSDFSGDLSQYTLPAYNNQTLANNDTTYVVARNFGAAAFYELTTYVLDINESDVVPVYTIYRADNELHILEWGTVGSGLVNKLHARVVKTERFKRESGLALGEAGTRNITTAPGVMWVGGNRTPMLGTNSATSDTEFWYHVSGVWTRADLTQYNNTQYDDGTDLQTVGVGRYVVNFVYAGVEEYPHLFYVLGGNNYTFSEAVASAPPSSLPEVITSHAVLVGRIVVVRDAATATQIDSAFTQQFTSSQVTDHNNLSNLQGGVAGEMYHMSAAQHLIATQPASASVDGYITTGEQTIAGTKIFLGNVTVQGTVSFLDSDTLRIKDKNIELAIVDTPTDITADGGGITLRGATDKTIAWQNATDRWHFNQGIEINTGDLIVESGLVQISAGNIVLADTYGILTDTSDGSDSAALKLNGGGAFSINRGAGIALYGNEHASTGSLQLSGGNVTDGHISFYTKNVLRVLIEDDGYVGIGIDPQVHLDVNTESAEATKVRINGEASQAKRLEIRNFASSEAAVDNNMIFIASKIADLGTLGQVNGSGVDVDVLNWDLAGNVGLGVVVFGTNATNVLGLTADGVVPTTSPAGMIQIYSDDSSDGATNATLALRTEQAIEVIGTFTPSHKLKIWHNGVEYWAQFEAV